MARKVCGTRERAGGCKDVPPLSLRGAQRRGNPYSLRQGITKQQYLGQIRRWVRIRPKYCQLARYFCGETDCHTSAIQATHPSPRLFRRKSQGSVTPLHRLLRAAQVRPGSHFALARNDMQKLAACPHCKDALGQKRGTFHPCLEVRKPTRFMDVIARSGAAAPRRGNPSLLRQHIAKSNT